MQQQRPGQGTSNYHIRDNQSPPPASIGYNRNTSQFNQRNSRQSSGFAATSPNSKYPNAKYNLSSMPSASAQSDSSSEFSMRYDDFASKPVKVDYERKVKRSVEFMDNRYIGGRWSFSELLAFIIFNILNVILIVGGIVFIVVGIPLIVQSQIQNILDGNGSAPKDVIIKQATVGQFTNTGFPASVSVFKKALFPILPLTITIGAITIDASVPSIPGDNQISTITTTPITITASQDIDITMTVNIQVNQIQQNALSQYVKNMDPTAEIKADVAVPVKVFGFPLYNPMRLKFTLVPAKLLSKFDFSALQNPKPIKEQFVQLSQKLSTTDDILALGPLGVGLNRVAMKLQDSGLDLAINADFEPSFPLTLSPIQSFSGYLGLGGNKRILQFYARNVSIQPGLQTSGMALGISFTDSRIDLQGAKNAMAEAAKKVLYEGGKIADIGLAVMGPFDLSGADFLSKISNDLAIVAPPSLLDAAASKAGNSPLAKMLTNEGLISVIQRSDFILHLLPQRINFHVSLPVSAILPLPYRPFLLPFNTSVTIADPETSKSLIKADISEMLINRDRNFIYADAAIQITPLSFSLTSLERAVEIGKGLLTAGQVNVRAKDFNLFSQRLPNGFQFFKNQLPVPPSISRTIDFCEGCFARALVFKVIPNIQLIR